MALGKSCLIVPLNPMTCIIIANIRARMPAIAELVFLYYPRIISDGYSREVTMDEETLEDKLWRAAETTLDIDEEGWVVRGGLYTSIHIFTGINGVILRSPIVLGDLVVNGTNTSGSVYTSLANPQVPAINPGNQKLRVHRVSFEELHRRARI
jgi:hypothetical protein